MKLFTEDSGKFQMYIPLEWEYKNPSFSESKNVPESFGTYTKMKGAFQISCKSINSHISNLIKTNGLNTQKSDSKHLKFKEKYIKSGSTRSYIWMAAVDDHFFLATYIFGKRKNKKELQTVRKALNTIKFIKPQFRDQVIALNRFDLFMVSMAATIDLKNRAIKNGSFIEYVVLTANYIDALLRLSIILKNQLENKNKEIDVNYLFQSGTDRPKMEKDIYKIALSRGIITMTLNDELYSLYNERNKVVHRYIITDIRTRDLLEIAMRYYKLEEKVGDIVSGLEQDQFKLKIGIYGSDIPPERKITGIELKRLQSQVRDKHGKMIWPKENNIIYILISWFRINILKEKKLRI